ncbi:succinylglutamate desuccinylase/aspartoacylase family protein [Aquiflexum gelatinilyticum]|uniref:Succinylglutamate desuccinylase/aspartoacylase family protein n=1 Tax=Aquiflexum gelatinilyticum TaxID=2961943 RepID=A0A9X2PAJ0_9BACT|nr:succinylglutamate desuccinylase/aspartoacylase family protein [Aquiflexum gelatinilyticum]MCR9017398.1 succinylglutamate desuccinylase/aspartoacylase family protein [Aquiflexum gelatinilyticum]
MDAQALTTKIEMPTNRVMQKLKGSKSGPTVLFFAGVHGNEPAGVMALKEVFEDLSKKENTLRGTVYGLIGNQKALAKGKRYVDMDLNRLWTKANIKMVSNKKVLLEEEKELLELLDLLREIIKTEKGPFYFIDYHTTSSKTLPFITINDSMINRKFARQFPVPIVLGIEEFLEGPLLSYINQLGYVAVGFESGQHTDPAAITNSVAFTYMTLAASGVIGKMDVEDFGHYPHQLEKAATSVRDIFEVVHLHRITGVDVFKMLPGFESFQKINKGTHLATNNYLPVYSGYDGRLFMPLYQNQGSDGFFIIRKIPEFALMLSALLRKIKIDNLFTLLPGVKWEHKDKEILRVNLNIAKFMTKPLFHLLGYRVRQLDGQYLRLYNREKASKKKMYKNEGWW